MKKDLEQRVADLEKEIENLKSKNHLAGVSLDELIALVTSAQQTTARGGAVILDAIGYMPNASLNLLSEPDLDTTFSSPFDKSEWRNFSLDAITATVPTHLDTDTGGVSPDQQNLSFEDYPQYPNITGSWDENPDDIVDEYGFKYNYSK